MSFKLTNLFRRDANRSALETACTEGSFDAGSLGRAAEAMSAGDLTQALRWYDAALAAEDERAETHYKRANVLNRLGRWQEALAGYDRAVELNPGYANAWCNRGTILERLGRCQEALASYDRAVTIDPGDAIAFYNRGSALRSLNRLDEACVSYERAIDLNGNYAEAYVNRGNVLQKLQHHDAALACYDHAIGLDCRLWEAYFGRGISLSRLKRHEDAVSSYQQALAIKPDHRYLAGMRRSAQMYLCDWQGLSEDLQALAAGIEAEMPTCAPFDAIFLFDSPSLQKKAALTWVREECPPDECLGAIRLRRHRRRIRVGYFSADFRHHPVSQLTAEMFEKHDRSKFEIIAFAFGPKVEDEMTLRLRSAFDRFVDVRERSDREVAQLARELEVDIAVDLGGYTEYCRTSIFAMRAAPVQMSYIGYLGTMGAPYMDYIVADPVLIPPERRADYAEKIIYLRSYQANDSQRRSSGRVFSREELGLPAQGFVFGCLNSVHKIMPDIFAAWMRILERVPASTLYLCVEGERARSNLRDASGAAGIDPSRVVFGDRLDVGDYLARYRIIDLFLDTLPYNAGATASDALWSGLPVLTCRGQSFAARYGASLLTVLGLADLITTSLEMYEQTAIRLAGDPDELARIREMLRQSHDASPLFDSTRFTRGLEDAYVQAYERSCSGLTPAHIDASDSSS